jgi:protein-S-isoprenylcysteine O-methyltransferase Ste14
MRTSASIWHRVPALFRVDEAQRFGEPSGEGTMKPTSIALGAAFLGTLFVLVPFGAIQLNEACEWPRWQIAGGRVVGSVLILAGIGVFAYCSGLFRRVGKGTPVPIEPPGHLVIEGLYRFSRNPMYVAQVVFLLGLFVYRGELALLLYAAFWAVAIHFSVVWREEPELRQRFGEEYVRYTREAPRWIPIWPRDTDG